MSFQTPFSSPDSTSSFTYRHFDAEHDLTPLVTLLSKVKQVDQDGEDVSEAFLREQLTWPDQNHEQDRWVATQADGNVLLGHGAIFKTPNDEHTDIGLAVHPAWRGRGIGSELLKRLLERAREKQAQDVRVYAEAKNKAAHMFLHKHGFEPVSTYTRLAVPGTHPFPQPDLPAGFVVRSYDHIQQIDLFAESMNQSYEGLWGIAIVARRRSRSGALNLR